MVSHLDSELALVRQFNRLMTARRHKEFKSFNLLHGQSITTPARGNRFLNAVALEAAFVYFAASLKRELR